MRRVLDVHAFAVRPRGARPRGADRGTRALGTHPRLTFTLGELVAARQHTPNIVAFRARGTITLIGKAQPVEVIGTLSRPDAAGLARLGLTGDVLIVNAQLSLRIKDTALAPDAADFDGDHITVNVTLMLRRNPEESVAKELEIQLQLTLTLTLTLKKA